MDAIHSLGRDITTALQYCKDIFEITDGSACLKDPTVFSESADMASTALLAERGREVMALPQPKGRDPMAQRTADLAK